MKKKKKESLFSKWEIFKLVWTFLWAIALGYLWGGSWVQGFIIAGMFIMIFLQDFRMDLLKKHTDLVHEMAKMSSDVVLKFMKLVCDIIKDVEKTQAKKKGKKK